MEYHMIHMTDTSVLRVGSRFTAVDFRWSVGASPASVLIMVYLAGVCQ